MLIEAYTLDVFTPACDPGAEQYAAKAYLAADIAAVLPYLNATLPGAVYYPAAQALTWKHAGHGVAFHPHEVAASSLEDKQAAMREVEALIELVNQTWERRAEITPDRESHRRPAPMAVYQQLPHTNCKACGEPTCYTFALKLTAGQRPPADCPALFEPGRETALAALRALLPPGWVG